MKLQCSCKLGSSLEGKTTQDTKVSRSSIHFIIRARIAKDTTLLLRTNFHLSFNDIISQIFSLVEIVLRRHDYNIN